MDPLSPAVSLQPSAYGLATDPWQDIALGGVNAEGAPGCLDSAVFGGTTAEFAFSAPLEVSQDWQDATFSPEVSSGLFNWALERQANDLIIGLAPDGQGSSSDGMSFSGDPIFGTGSSAVTTSPSHELLILDAGVENLDQLVAGARGGLEVVVLDAGRDGISQITELLRNRQGLTAVHLVSHGSQGALQLGSVRLDAESLQTRAAEVASWGGALNATGDLLLYGCDVASTRAGEAFITRLAELTGADVAGSDDPTGSSLLGGDWELEEQAGTIEGVVAFSAEVTRLYDHLLAATLSPEIEAAISTGLNSLEQLADDINALEQLTADLPLVGESIGSVLAFGDLIREKLIQPITDYFAANNPNSTTALVTGLNIAFDAAGSPINLVDESTPDEVRLRVQGFAFTELLEDVKANLGEQAEALGLDVGTGGLLDFLVNVDLGGTNGFVIGYALDPSLAPSDAFFLDFTGSSLTIDIDTPFANKIDGETLDFAIRLGMLGEVQVTDGSFDLDVAIPVTFTDSVLTASEILGSSLTELISITPTATLSASLTISAKLAGLNVGTAEIAVGLTGDPFNESEITVSVNNQAFKDFSNISPGDVVAALTQLATTLEGLADSFDLPAGIPFIEDQVSDLISFADQLNDLTRQLFKQGLQGGIAFVESSLNGADAVFNVVVDGVATTITVAVGTTLSTLETTVQAAFDAASLPLEAVLDNGRLLLRTVDNTIETLTFANVNAVAQAALGFFNTQAAIPFYDFITFQDLEQRINDILPSGFSLTYDSATQTIGLALELFGSVSESIDLSFNKDIDLGGLATLSLYGAGMGSAAAAARLSLEAFLDLNPLEDSTLLKDLNGGLGIRTNGTAAADLNFQFDNGSTDSVDLDLLNLSTATVADLKSLIADETDGEVEVDFNFTQDGLILRDGTHAVGTVGQFRLTFATGSAAAVDLGFGVGIGDVDNDGILAGGPIVSRLFLKPYDGIEGSILAAGLQVDASELNLGASLGVLEVGVSGGTTTPITLAARGALVDPDGSGRLYLPELAKDPSGSISVGFGSFADAANLGGTFTDVAAGDVLGALDLNLSFDGADTYGIDLGSELASIAIQLKVQSVSGLVPLLVPEVDIDTATFPNFSALLESFQNLSIPQLLSLVTQVVQQFQNLPLINQDLPLLGESIGDLVSFVSNKVGSILGDFTDLQGQLSQLFNQVITGLRDQADTLVLNGQSLADGLVALGEERQMELFHLLATLSGAIQQIPADLNLLVEAESRAVQKLSAAFRALRGFLQEIEDDVADMSLPDSASAVVAYFTETVGDVTALADRSFVRQVLGLIPSGDRIVQVLMEALGLDLLDLSEAANATALTAVTAARTKVDELLAALPELPSDADLGSSAPLIAVRDQAQLAVNSSEAALQKVSERLELAVDNFDVFAALRAVSYLSEAISSLRSAIQILVDDGAPEFGVVISDLQNLLLGVIDDVRAEVFEAFPLGALTFSLPDGGKALQVDLHVARTLTQDVSVEFDLDDVGLPAFIPLNFEGEVKGPIILGADFRFGFGLDLDPSSVEFLNPYIAADSEVALTAALDLLINAEASIGGLSLAVNNGVVKLLNSIDLGADGAVGGTDADADSFGGPAILALGLNDPTPGDGRVLIGELLSAFDPRFEAELLVNLPVDVLGTEFDIFALFDIASFDDFDLAIPDLPDGLVDEILNGLTELNLANILAGLKVVLGSLESTLKSDLLTQIPAIGDDLSGVGDILGDVNGFIDDFEKFINETLGGLNAEAVLDQLKKFIFDTLGPGGIGENDILSEFTPWNILQIDPAVAGDTAVANWEDLWNMITYTGPDITAANALQVFEAGFDFDLRVGFDETLELPLDFGFEGMGLALESDTKINFRIAPELGLAFGVNRASGFYVDLDRTGGSLAVQAYLDQDSELALKLWFLELSATPAALEDYNGNGTADDTGLDEAADNIDYNRDGDTLDVLDESGDSNGDGEITGGVGVYGVADLSLGSGKLTFNDLDDFAPEFTLEAKADLDVAFEASLAGQQSLPSLEALLDFDWSFELGDPLSIPEVRFANVALDLGSFFRDNISPVIEQFQVYLQPLQAIFDVVNAEIPVISELAELLGQDPVTFLDMVGLLGSGFEEVAAFVETLSSILEIIDTISDVADALGSGRIEFGDLALPDVNVTDVASRSSIRSFDDEAALDTSQTFIDAAANAESLLGDLESGGGSSSVGVTNGQFFFPVIDDPFGTLAGFLLGQTRDLVVWDLPDFVAQFSYSQLFGPLFPPIPLFAKIFGSFTFSTDFALGFDTRGIQQGFADFYNGFYLRDWQDDNLDGILSASETTEARELGLDLEFGAGAELNVVVASAGVEGGINAAITADWHDVLEDGKFYVDELGQRMSQSLACIFELSGKLDAFLRAFLKLGFDTPFGFVTLFEESLDLLNVTLLDFSVSCPPLPIPQPGRWENVGDRSTLILNIGREAGHRQPGATDVAEIVEVFGERDTDGDAATKLSLDLGIVDSDGDGDIDSDDVDAWVAGGNTLSALIDLNADNRIDVDEARRLEDFNNNGSLGSAGSDKGSVLLIGFGQWQLFLDDVDLIRGDGDNKDDQIIFDHSVWVPGDLSGGGGKDKIQGGQGNDTIEGGSDDDILIGGFGDDTIKGDGGLDLIYGNAGSDILEGGNDNDTVYGDDGNGIQPLLLNLQGDPLSPASPVAASNLNDTIRGGDGEDNLFGEWGDDTIYGDSGPDQLSGGHGDDELRGGADPDLLEGNEGADRIYGEGGADLLFGEADGISTASDGNDLLDGGVDNDTIRDDQGDDTVIGGFGDDFIVTGLGNDVIFGDLDPRAGGAAPIGGSGRDTIYADRDALPEVDDGLGLGAGDDYVEGGAEADTIFAGDGKDRVIGGSSPFALPILASSFSGNDAGDAIVAGGGDDIVAGDNASIGIAGDVTSAATVTTYGEGGAGADTIHGGDGNDWIFGGGSGDQLFGDDAGGTGDDIIVGDQGTLTSTKIEALHSDLPGSAGTDLLVGYAGNDILLGGDFGDQILGNAGDDVLVGDNGTVSLLSALVVRVATRNPAHGGNDWIFGDAGLDIAFGGVGDDLIYGGSDNISDGADILFGDNGVAVFLDGSIEENDLYSTDPTYGGVDLIVGGYGGDILVGGSGGNDATPTGGDLLYGQSGNDVIAGDNVRINRQNGGGSLTDPPAIERIFSLFSANGGDDLLEGSLGSDLLIGGFGDDSGTGGLGDDILVGDNGEVRFDVDSDLASLDVIRSMHFADGGIDILTGEQGADVLIGGTAGDLLYGDDSTASHGGDDGEDILLADNAEILLAGTSGRLFVEVLAMAAPTSVVRITSLDVDDSTGGADTVEGNAGSDLIIGGVNDGGVDRLYGDRASTSSSSIALDGDDVILGDQGELAFTDGDFDPSSLDRITAFSDQLGGKDELSGNTGSDIALGGVGDDRIYGDDASASAEADDGEDVLLGDNGEVLLTGSAFSLPAQLYALGSAIWLIRSNDDEEQDGGEDIIEGNGESDVLIGGVDADILFGDAEDPVDNLDGDDILIGDNGLLYFGGDDDLLSLDLIRSHVGETPDGLGSSDQISGNAGRDVAIGSSGDDTIYGDNDTAAAGELDGADILLGDNAVIVLANQSASADPLNQEVRLRGGSVALIRTTDVSAATGGADKVEGNAAGDFIAGGVDRDVLYGDAATTAVFDGNDILLGDNGSWQWLSDGDLDAVPDAEISNMLLVEGFATIDDDITTLDLVTTEQPTNGDRDVIEGDAGSDWIFGGTGADLLFGDDRDGAGAGGHNDLIFGDHGRIYPQFSAPAGASPTAQPFGSGVQSRNFFAIDTGVDDGGDGDEIFGEEGDDILLGQQGDDRLWGGDGNDDMIGGHNVAEGVDELAGDIDAQLSETSSNAIADGMNDLMDGGAGDDAMAGDNAAIWRRGDDLSPRFRALTAATIYTTTESAINTNVGDSWQSDPNDAVGRDIQLLDHSDAVLANPLGRFGQDVMAGGADDDMMFGQLGDDLMQGDGSIGTAKVSAPFISRRIDVTDSGSNPDTDAILYFNIPETPSTDGDDYVEGNGGRDLMYGGLGQDDMIGGSSELFGLITEAMRPDDSDVMFGGAGIHTGRNDLGDATQNAENTITPTSNGNGLDADYLMGDNANIYRLILAATDSYLRFNYDSAYGIRIVPRAMQQLDYHLGGADYNAGVYSVSGQAQPAGLPADNGGADLIHGESGDDVIFGMTGSDVLFGDGQDDDIVGGYGHDWISGGTGQDGILGDDGLVLTSRNSTIGEVLYGIAGLLATDPDTRVSNGNVLNELIATPGSIQNAVINLNGQLKKTMDLVPFSYDSAWLGLDDEYPDSIGSAPFADDIIFGGLGSDWLHGGSGDDAISGAEALAAAYVPTYAVTGIANGIYDLGYAAVGIANALIDNRTNTNPGNVLAYNAADIDGQHDNNRFRAGEFRLYDEYDPRREILLTATGELSKIGAGYQFLLNFDETEGVIRSAGTVPKSTGQQASSYPQVNDDGDDKIFGDLGNDWMVGGTGRDNAYGGWGNDLLNVDDTHATSNGLNDQPDTHPSFEDRAYGGAGRDVLIGNTGGDRLIDWVGEYNSYLVPFAPFGQAAVSRTLQPFLPEFLYALSEGDGADPTRASYVGDMRNGEPAGELGLVLQKDQAWQDQTGAPSDPQAGNIPGGKRDVLRSADFTGNQAQGFVAEAGAWTVTNGRYEVSPRAGSGTTDAISLFNADVVLPSYFEIVATINAVKPTAGFKANAYVIFDYVSPTNFKFAGVNISTKKFEIGQRTAAGWEVRASLNVLLKQDIDYGLLVSINGNAVTAVLNGQQMLSFAFAPRQDADGFTYLIRDGMVGLGGDNARARIDNVRMQVIPPVVTASMRDGFDGPASTLLNGSPDSWIVQAGRYVATPVPGAPFVVAGSDLSVGANAFLQLDSVVRTATMAGLVFDMYSLTDFKWTAVSVMTQQILVGHYTDRGGWVVDAAVSRSLFAGTDYSLSLSLKGSTVNVTLNGVSVLSKSFNSNIVDGAIGTFARGGTASFDSFGYATDDPGMAVIAPAGQTHSTTGAPSLLLAAQPSPPRGDVVPILTDFALEPLRLESFRRLRHYLTASQISWLEGLSIVITDLPDQQLGAYHDGRIWIDSTAAGHGWFLDPTPAADQEFTASNGLLMARIPAALGHIDLLTVLLHEFSHASGLNHGSSALMSDVLSTGVRLLPQGAYTVPRVRLDSRKSLRRDRSSQPRLRRSYPSGSALADVMTWFSAIGRRS